MRSPRPGIWVATLALVTAIAVLALDAAPAHAGIGRLIATGGATQIEGAAGSGLVPWAVLSSYATREEVGGTLFTTYVDTGDYAVSAFGGAVTVGNRIEISGARLELRLGTLGTELGLPGASIAQNVAGVKVRIVGDAIYTSWPQVSLGAFYRETVDFDVPAVVGAERDDDLELYVAATKIFLGAVAGRNLLVNGTLRATRANQIGFLGFGGDLGDSREIMPEVSLALLLDPQTAIGIDYRAKPDNLSFAEEEDWADLFFAYFPNKHLALVAAYTDLGTVASLPDQGGLYLSVQASF